MNAAHTPPPHCISLDAAEAMTGISRRTLWRRVADGALVSGPDKDARGRTTLQLDGLLEAAREHTGLALGADQLNLLLQADAGQGTAQAELGALMQLSGKTQGGVYWLRQAAEQGEADAMHWLGLACATQNTEQGQHEAMMWVARAAAHGHVIAQQQIHGLLTGVRTGPEPARTGR